MAAERPSKRVCLDTFLFTSESVGEGHPGKQGRARAGLRALTVRVYRQSLVHA